MSTQPAARLSVVIGTFNRLEQLRACIDSVFKGSSVPVRVYVTDAGSTDGTVEYLKANASDQFVPVLVGRRIGQARAYNDIFNLVETPYTCWLSDDNVVVNQGLDIAVRILDQDSRIGMVGLKVKDVTGPFVDAPYVGGISSAGILNINQGVVRTSILRDVCGFSEVFRDYGIDPDLTAKVLFRGHIIAYTKQIAIHHYRNWNADQSSPDHAAMMARQKAYLARYSSKYDDIAPASPAARLKQWVWNLIPGIVGVPIPITAKYRLFGVPMRDWHNIFNGRYIRMLDPIWCVNRAYHLVQYCPPSKRPANLPIDLPDPVLEQRA